MKSLHLRRDYGLWSRSMWPLAITKVNSRDYLDRLMMNSLQTLIPISSREIWDQVNQSVKEKWFPQHAGVGSDVILPNFRRWWNWFWEPVSS